MKRNILVINTGSTSTKLAYFIEDKLIKKEEYEISKEVVRASPRILDQLPIRLECAQQFVDKNQIDLNELDMIVSRGPSINGVKCGAYCVDSHVLSVLKYAPRSQHASMLSPFIASGLAEGKNIPVIFYDSPSSDEADEILHYTGRPEIKRFVSGHVLNQRMVAREVAKTMGKRYEDCNFIVSHLGGGITTGFHSGGVIIDSVGDDAGPMSPQRVGRLPVRPVINMCFSGKYTREEMLLMMRGTGGLVAYFGVQDVREIEKKILEGDQFAEDLYRYMAYQVSKSIAELSCVKNGKVDAVILTGGIAHSKMFTQWIKERVEYIAPVIIVPGEREMEALAMGGLRVMDGQEQLKNYTWLPDGYPSLEALINGEKGSKSK